MKTTPTFSDEARLYAKYAYIVDAMHERFQADIDSFLNSLREAVDDHLPNAELKEATTGGYRYWWLDGDSQHQCVHLWLKRHSPEMVPSEGRPGRIVATVGVPIPHRGRAGSVTSAVETCIAQLADTAVTAEASPTSEASPVSIHLEFSGETELAHLARTLVTVLNAATQSVSGAAPLPS